MTSTVRRTHAAQHTRTAQRTRTSRRLRASDGVRGLMTHWADGESGRRDLRMLPAALCLWAAALATRAVLPQEGTGSLQEGAGGMRGLAVVLCLGASAVMFASVHGVHAWLRHARAGHAPPALRCASWLLVCMAAALTGAFATAVATTHDMADPAIRMSRTGSARATVDIRTRAPALRSASRAAACTVHASTRAVQIGAVQTGGVQTGGVRMPSDVDVRVLLPDALCMRVVQGGEYRLSGTLARAPWDERTLQLTVAAADADTAVVLRAPAPWRRAVHTMQRRFFAVADGLSDQGRVLVPGLTLGVLGQDALGEGEPVDEVYASRLEEGCRRAGIIHLMAVSGGHYALLASAATALCSWTLAPRWAVAAARAAAVVALTAVLVPSESIMRAVVMHLFALGYVLLGRREQTTPLLLWTAIVAIVIKPARAADFGFALSCAAVLGIALVSGPLAAVLRQWLPRRMADALATTIGAQLLTSPLQLLMQPQIALWAVPANLLVAPWMDMATVCGLGAYTVSWCMPTLGFALAWCASLGTKSVEIAADVFGADDGSAQLAWPSDTAGALRLAGAETLVVLIVVLLRAMARLRDDMSKQCTAVSGRRIGASPAPFVRMRLWWERTWAMLTCLRWRPRGPAHAGVARHGVRHADRRRDGRREAGRRRNGHRRAGRRRRARRRRWGIYARSGEAP